jgi:hypothetical protein
MILAEPISDQRSALSVEANAPSFSLIADA